jgi:hypothetical protein
MLVAVNKPWRTWLGIAALVAAVLLLQHVVLPRLGLRT